MQGSGKPKDVETVEGILRDMGVRSYEPAVVDQLLEFMHSYTVSVLRDAQIYQVNITGPDLSFSFLFFFLSFFSF